MATAIVINTRTNLPKVEGDSEVLHELSCELRVSLKDGPEFSHGNRVEVTVRNGPHRVAGFSHQESFTLGVEGSVRREYGIVADYVSLSLRFQITA